MTSARVKEALNHIQSGVNTYNWIHMKVIFQARLP